MRYFLIVTFTTLCIFTNAQQPEWAPITREVIIVQGDSSIRAKVLIKQQSIAVNEKAMYYWHNKGQINRNIGGYTGELLHGDYFVFDNQKRLVTQGIFDHGLMTGKWKFWYPNGQLHYLQNYKKGMLDGIQEVYDQNGNLSSVNLFKEGKIVPADKVKSKKKNRNKMEVVSDTIPNESGTE
jgi:antitoxin component YwqK of YwqJK toxin-antitoxin module